MRRHITVALAAMLVAAGCSQDPTGASNSELCWRSRPSSSRRTSLRLPAPIVKGWWQRLRDTLPRPMIPRARRSSTKPLHTVTRPARRWQRGHHRGRRTGGWHSARCSRP